MGASFVGADAGGVGFWLPGNLRQLGRDADRPWLGLRIDGFTEGGDVGLTDREMLAQGRHTTVQVLPKNTKRMTKQVFNGAKKRRTTRTKDGHLSE